jgi:hypothetical protein
MRLPYRPRVSSLHFVPHVKHMRRITTAMRRCPGAIQQHESLYWAWDRRAYLFTVILAQMKTHYQQHVGASEFGRFFENSQ